MEALDPGQTTPRQVLHVLASKSGELWTLGRKAGDLTFVNDKSVSRQHCRLVCRDDSSLAVENFGGKGGTFVVEPPTNETTDDEDDATDDEGSHPLTASQREGTVVTDMPLSTVAQDYWKQQDVNMIRLDLGQSRAIQFSNRQRTVFLQVGLHGSTVRMTWIPFNFVFSRVPSKVHNEWNA